MMQIMRYYIQAQNKQQAGPGQYSKWNKFFYIKLVMYL
jgi:hypothetical protein